MINKKFVQEALRHILPRENNSQAPCCQQVPIEDKEISLLLHDVFGAEILKTPGKKGWHFYNRIKGERLDYSNFNERESSASIFKDIPSNQDEACQYIDPDDYSSFYMKFVRAFDEIIGLKIYANNSRSKLISSYAR